MLVSYIPLGTVPVIFIYRYNFNHVLSMLQAKCVFNDLSNANRLQVNTFDFDLMSQSRIIMAHIKADLSPGLVEPGNNITKGMESSHSPLYKVTIFFII